MKKLQDLVETTKAPRTAIAAARALGQFARLELDEQRLQLQQPPPKPPEVDHGPDVRGILLEQNPEDESTINKWKSQYTKKQATYPSGSQ